jgi:tetratricopeptide (TPR) repeat protein
MAEKKKKKNKRMEKKRIQNYIKKANVHKSKKYYNLAIIDFDYILTSFCLNPVQKNAILFEKAECWMYKKKYEKAINIYSLILSIKKNERALYLRTQAFNAMQEYVKEIKDLSFLITDYPKNVKLYMNRANSYFKLEKYDLCIRDCLIIKKIKKGDGYIDKLIGDIYFHQEEYTNAIDSYILAHLLVDNIKTKCDIMIKMGNIYRLIDKYDISKQYYKDVLRLDENHIDAYYNLGILEYTMENYDEAIEYFKLVKVGKNQILEVFYLIGKCYEKRKEYKKALKYYKISLVRCAPLSGEDPLAMEAVGRNWKHMGYCYEYLKQWKKAIIHYNGAIQRNSKYKIKLNRRINHIQEKGSSKKLFLYEGLKRVDKKRKLF